MNNTFSPSMAFAVEGFFLNTIDKLSLQRYNDSKQRTIVRTIPAIIQNCFLMIGAVDFGANQALEIPEHFVYCGFFNAMGWDKRYGQIAKGLFCEIAHK